MTRTLSPTRDEVLAQVADRALDDVGERLVPEVRPAVVHVEQRHVHHARIGGWQVSRSLDARKAEPALFRRVGQSVRHTADPCAARWAQSNDTLAIISEEPSMHRTVTLLTVCAALAVASQAPRAQSGPDIDALLGAPFPTELVAAPTGGGFAWVASASGVQNLWVAEPPAFAARAVTAYRDDDGQWLSQPAWSADGTDAGVHPGGGTESRRGVAEPGAARGWHRTGRLGHADSASDDAGDATATGSREQSGAGAEGLDGGVDRSRANLDCGPGRARSEAGAAGGRPGQRVEPRLVARRHPAGLRQQPWHPQLHRRRHGRHARAAVSGIRHSTATATRCGHRMARASPSRASSPPRGQRCSRRDERPRSRGRFASWT